MTTPILPAMTTDPSRCRFSSATRRLEAPPHKGPTMPDLSRVTDADLIAAAEAQMRRLRERRP